MNTLRLRAFPQCHLNCSPKILNWVEIRALRGPGKYLHIFLGEEIRAKFAVYTGAL